MTELGKKIRLRRIFDTKTNTTLIVPMDHAVEAYFKQLEEPGKIIKEVINAGANALLLRRGLAKLASPHYMGQAGLILRVSCATGLRNKLTEQILVSSVEEALRLGADAVAITVFVGSQRETEDLRWLGMLSDECDKWGMPLLGEMLPIGGEGSIPFDGPYNADDVRLAVRVGMEEGVDFIKTYYTGDIESFKKVVKYANVPVVIAGGPKVKTIYDLLKMVKDAMDSGASGASIGRNIWMYEDPASLVKALLKIIREKASVNEAMKELNVPL